MSLYEAIKNKSIEQVKLAAEQANLNERDKFGRTALHYAITQKSTGEMIETLLKLGADPGIPDKLHETALSKAIKFQNKEAVELLLNELDSLDHPEGIRHTYWFQARHDPSLADTMLATKGSVRLTLNEAEKDLLDEILYPDSDEQEQKWRELATPELLHALVMNFNWDDEPEPMHGVIEHPACLEITAIDMYDLVDGDYWRSLDEVQEDFQKSYLSLVDKIAARFPSVLE
ncbi:DUF4274 domain-containing protein [Paenibacillus sp. N10]|uniref:DUF4274 domain-containing protein n=1 Tax=Paenibacillus lutrae TaxID=2078573 RepID=A0A7X3JXF7_9BACL|nr:DUF4274 domain-containing protein [Paenibacillus lutrae]